MSPESKHEYKVVPAPMKGMKAKGVKGTPARFAHALEVLMNEDDGFPALLERAVGAATTRSRELSNG